MKSIAEIHRYDSNPADPLMRVLNHRMAFRMQRGRQLEIATNTDAVDLSEHTLRLLHGDTENGGGSGGLLGLVDKMFSAEDFVEEVDSRNRARSVPVPLNWDNQHGFDPEKKALILRRPLLATGSFDVLLAFPDSGEEYSVCGVDKFGIPFCQDYDQPPRAVTDPEMNNFVALVETINKRFRS